MRMKSCHPNHQVVGWEYSNVRMMPMGINLLDVQRVGGYLSSESIAKWLRESVSQRNGNIVILNEFPLVLCESTRRVVGWPSMHFTALLTH